MWEGKRGGGESTKQLFTLANSSRNSSNVTKPVLQRTKTDLLKQQIETESSRHSKEKKSEPTSKIGDHKEPRESSTNQEVTRHAAPRVPDVTDSSEEYDTDLETECGPEMPDDRWGRRVYARACRRMGLSPSGSVLRGLRGPVLDLTGRGMDQRHSLALAVALLENMAVRCLHLAENRLGDMGVEYVAQMLYENDVIYSLNLSHNFIKEAGVRHLLEMLLVNSNITKLALAGNNLTDKDALMFAEYLEKSKSLNHLDLSHNNFGDSAGKALGPAIATNPSLRSLDLSWNKIRTQGGVAICRALQANTFLKTLNLAYNGLSNTGVVHMAQTLTVNSTLHDLDLTCNRVFDESMTHIAKALAYNNTLKFLRVSNNPLTSVSVISLLQSILGNTNCAMELLDLSNIHIYKSALYSVEEIKSSRPSFKLKYGGIVRSDDTFGEEDKAFDSRNPLTILKEYIASKNLRLVDLFKQFDKDGGGSISRQEFVDGLKTIEVPLTQQQLDDLITMLDKDGDGEVDYGELVAGDREYRRKVMRMKQKALVRMAQGGQKGPEPRDKLLAKGNTHKEY